MNDDAPDLSTPSPELEAVAAVLDGTATLDEQALVDASPVLQALLADFAADQAAIADVSDIEITTEVREWSIAAALGAYDQMLAGAAGPGAAAAAAPAAPATSADATVLRFERRRRTYRTLMGAAAAVVVVLVGVTVVGGLGDPDGESTDAPMAVSAKTDTTAPTAALAATSADSGVLEQADATATATADTTVVDGESVAAPDAAAAPAYTIGVDGATVGSDLQAPQDLVDFAMGKAAMTLAEGDGLPCVTEGAEAVGAVRYQGVDAIVTRDPATGQLTAFDLTTCAVLAQAGP
jgi:uncharacterized protein YbaA (DUF1428 family)